MSLNSIRARQVAHLAIQARNRYSLAQADQPVCPYNIAEALGLDVRFVAIPSFEGMYLASEQKILISAERPEGRKRMTCAHEIGHHVMGHGDKIDEIVESGSDALQELEADYFSSMLLMPPKAIRKAANARGITLDRITPAEAYKLANYFGMSYAAFLVHASLNIKLISRGRLAGLRAVEVAEIKESILGFKSIQDVFQPDVLWESRALDMVVGDYLSLPTETVVNQGNQELLQEVSSRLWRAMAPGICKLEHPCGWACYVRIARRGFMGMSQYRHLEDG